MSKVDQIPDPPLAGDKDIRKPHQNMKKNPLFKVRKSVRQSLQTQKEKARKARTNYERLAHVVREKQNKIKDINESLKGKKTTIVTGEQLIEATPTVMDYIEGREIIFKPNPGPQEEFLAAPEREVFYGGARGGGKSYAMLIDPLRDCGKQVHRALLLRKTLPELRDLIDHSRRLYPKAYPGAKYREDEKVWRFPSGARIEFGYAENMADALRYQGQSYTWIGVDELPQYPTPDIWNFLRSSLRSVDPSIPEYMRATGNPGNIGSWWVRQMFIDSAVWGEPFKVPVDTPSGTKTISRRFIPAKLSDNPYLTQTDNYMIMLASLPEVQKKQFLEGNWDVFDNAAFPEFSREIHVVTPFTIPNSWIKFRAADWGYSSKACCLWFAVDYDNNLWVYQELYVDHLTADIFARRVLELSSNDANIRYSIMDASTWQRRGDVGPSIVETMRANGVHWRPSDKSPNSRKNGKLEVHRRLAHGPGKKPCLHILSNCVNLIRTIPQLPLDKNDIEDVDTDSEDHAYDALRYGCMSRPIGPHLANKLSEFARSSVHKVADNKFGY